MKDELARAIDEHLEACKELQEFYSKYSGTAEGETLKQSEKGLTPEALEKQRLLLEKVDKTHDRMMKLFRGG